MPPTDVTEQILSIGPMFPQRQEVLDNIVSSMVMSLIVVLILALVTLDFRVRRRRHQRIWGKP